jgi:hypothetical protein
MLKEALTESYPHLLLSSTEKKNFTALARKAEKSASTVARELLPAEVYDNETIEITYQMFENSKTIYFIIDDTLIKKLYAQEIEGLGRHYHKEHGGKIKAFKLLVASISDGKYLIPFMSELIYDKDIVSNQIPSKDTIIQNSIISCKKMFPEKKIIILADSAFATISFLEWATKNLIGVELRMHSNRKVLFNGEKIAIKLTLRYCLT